MPLLTPTPSAARRTERDTFGPIEVPRERLWGAQTQRSLACARVNPELALLAPHKAMAIASAAQEALDGEHNAEFPLSVWQTGSGTQSRWAT